MYALQIRDLYRPLDEAQQVKAILESLPEGTSFVPANKLLDAKEECPFRMSLQRTHNPINIVTEQRLHETVIGLQGLLETKLSHDFIPEAPVIGVNPVANNRTGLSIDRFATVCDLTYRVKNSELDNEREAVRTVLGLDQPIRFVGKVLMGQLVLQQGLRPAKVVKQMIYNRPTSLRFTPAKVDHEFIEI